MKRRSFLKLPAALAFFSASSSLTANAKPVVTGPSTDMVNAMLDAAERSVNPPLLVSQKEIDQIFIEAYTKQMEDFFKSDSPTIHYGYLGDPDISKIVFQLK